MKEDTRFICEKETGKLLLPDDIKEKSDNYVKDAL